MPAAIVRQARRQRKDIATAASGAMPLATMAMPVVRPKGTTPNNTGSAARRPATNVARSKAVAIAASGV